MRLVERTLKPVYIAPGLTQTDALGGVRRVFSAERVPARASLIPAEGAIERRESGLTAAGRCLALLPLDAPIAAGEVMGTLMRNTKHILWPARNVLRGLSRLADAVDTDRNFSEQYADAFLFPRRLYILIANTNWQLLKKQARRKNKG